MESTAFVLKGHVLHTPNPAELEVFADSYVVSEGGVCRGVFNELPEKYHALPLLDYSERLIIPGLTDLHLHAPQYTLRGFGMDLELLDWLNQNTFPEEEKYSDIVYAEQAYELFVRDMANGVTTRAAIFSTVHVEATLLLMDMLEQSGLRAMVGKVNMDRNCSANLCEASPEASLEATERWLEKCRGRYTNTKPILTPRFVPSCSDGLLKGLGELQRQSEGLGMQSHLCENIAEIELVKELIPQSTGYVDAYRRFGLLGGEACPTIMAHCVYMRPEEVELMARNDVYIAHCPQSNSNLSSGIAPIRRYLQASIHVGLGTDIGAGHSTSMFRAIADTVQMSKLYWRLVDQDLPAITFAEAFYLATKGGGAFFGKVGSFEDGYEFDALVLDDTRLKTPRSLSPEQRLERCIYLDGDVNIEHKYVSGHKLF